MAQAQFDRHLKPGDARAALDRIASSQAFQSSRFSSSVYEDEPILRTGSQFRRDTETSRPYQLIHQLAQREDLKYAPAAKVFYEQARALAGRDDVLTGTSETMPWFSFDEDDEPGMLKFDSELYHGEGQVEIPDVFNGELVRGIAEGSFWRCDFLTAVSLPPSVRIIAKRAFSTCKRLEAIELPDAVTEIGENAFSDCTALSEVRFGSGLVSISQRAFDGCTALSSVSLPEGTVFLGYRAFGGCTALADITLPASLETVEAQAFSGCDAVSGVTFNGSRARLDSLLSAGGEELLKAKEIICTDGKTK